MKKYFLDRSKNKWLDSDVVYLQELARNFWMAHQDEFYERVVRGRSDAYHSLPDGPQRREWAQQVLKNDQI